MRVLNPFICARRCFCQQNIFRTDCCRYPNSINLNSHGVTPIAIFSMVGFDATSVSPSTVNVSGASIAMRGKERYMTHEEDANTNGMVDLVVQVVTSDIRPSLLEEDENGLVYATLTGNTNDGEAIGG